MSTKPVKINLSSALLGGVRMSPPSTWGAAQRRGGFTPQEPWSSEAVRGRWPSHGQGEREGGVVTKSRNRYPADAADAFSKNITYIGGNVTSVA